MPAGKVSFCVSAENARMGTYNGFEREEVEPGVIDDVFRDIGATLPLFPTLDQHGSLGVDIDHEQSYL